LTTLRKLRKWWAYPRIPISPTRRLQLSWVWLVGSLLGWPISQATFAAGEPPTVLALSWLAITITAIDALLTSDVRAEQDD
jgi:hypothetical protein